MLKDLKVDVGQRFKQFRVDRKKAQHIMAKELEVHQSTITNIEHGTTFPKINYLQYFYEKYGLNINWLITGEGEMYMKGHPAATQANIIKMPPVEYGDPRFDSYNELMTLMNVPAVEQVMMAKLQEVKILFKDVVAEFMNKQDEVKKDKEKRVAKAKVKK